jgi:two-component system, cell cycle sensor histidine kinase and response regulator CckA
MRSMGCSVPAFSGVFSAPRSLFHGIDVTDTPQGRERATTILVAEDDDALRGIVTRVFWDQGFRTLEARHGGEALHLAELAAPYLDLVVTDVIMPEVDGLELGRRLAECWASIPILYISAYPPNDIFSRGGPVRPSPFLQKPFTPEVLLERVRELLAGAKGRS